MMDGDTSLLGRLNESGGEEQERLADQFVVTVASDAATPVEDWQAMTRKARGGNKR